MTIIFIDSFYAIGQSTDAKPAYVPVGFRFQEIDSGRVFYWDGDSWNVITGGTAGTWNPFAAEELRNKEINLALNAVFKDSQGVGLFGFDTAGNFLNVPIGSANLYLKVKGTGDGFEFGDPAVSGSWDPNSTEAFTNKTLNVLLNHLKQTTPAAGSLLLDNGTDFVPLPKGSIGQVVKVKQDGSVGWDTDEVGTGGGGGGSVTGSAFLPSEANRFSGWYGGGTSADKTLAHGELAGNLMVKTSGVEYFNGLTPSRGNRITFNHAGTSHYGGVMSKEPIWMRGTDPYIKAKFRFSVNTDWDIHIGMSSNLTDSYDSETAANGDHFFGFARHSTLSHGKYSIIRNDGSDNLQERATTLSPSANVVTVELKGDIANNRMGSRINNEDSTDPASWAWETTSLPSLTSQLGLVCMADSDTSTAFSFEIYLIETTSKLLV